MPKAKKKSKKHLSRKTDVLFSSDTHYELNGVKNYLQQEVQPTLEFYLKNKNPEGRIIGFSAMAKILMPIIESTAGLLFHSEKKYQRIYRLLEEIGIPYPAISWEVFRNETIHQNKPGILFVGRTLFIWSWSMTGMEHTTSVSINYSEKTFLKTLTRNSNHIVKIHLDLSSLSKRLADYIKQFIAENPARSIRVKEYSRIFITKRSKNSTYSVKKIIEETNRILN